MEAPIQLHQFAKMRTAIAPPAVLLAFASLAPKPFGQHPSP